MEDFDVHLSIVERAVPGSVSTELATFKIHLRARNIEAAKRAAKMFETSGHLSARPDSGMLSPHGYIEVEKVVPRVTLLEVLAKAMVKPPRQDA